MPVLGRPASGTPETLNVVKVVPNPNPPPFKEAWAGRPNLKCVSFLMTHRVDCPTIVMPNGLERARGLVIKLLKDAHKPGYGVKVRCKETEFTSRHFVLPKMISRIDGGLQSS